MIEIEIPFNAWSKERLADGRKSCTSRFKRLGNPDDTFKIDNRAFIITGIVKATLGYVRNNLYIPEGCTFKWEFESVWERIYKRKFNPDREVYVHFFAEVRL